MCTSFVGGELFWFYYDTFVLHGNFDMIDAKVMSLSIYVYITIFIWTQIYMIIDENCYQQTDELHFRVKRECI